MKKGLVMEGGAMRGLFTAGVTDVLMENGIEFDGAVGVSAGATFGCNVKSRQIGRTIRYNRKYCGDWRYGSVKSFLKTGSMFDFEFCYRLLPEKLEIYLQLLQEWNRRMDLTAVEEESEMLDRHFMDSLAVLGTNLIRSGDSLIDVGTGAGFPGMVLAMALPGLSVTLMDAQQKRLRFLEAVRDAAGVGNTMILHARAEDAARNRKYREQFDIAAARAVAPLNVLCENRRMRTVLERARTAA